ncbi:hypothetical protein MANAM107_25730 [Actinomyces capricornis]|uniref:Uncharacterized protein n=1 Tax=Actinomyces capricornis TaxID=2755559 RepID=A0ABM7UQQ8_9ACTO|nr:hypothetical protein MANAM107_25730 [Actinomyces capricornis]
MLNTLADLATLLAAVPVAVAALVFLCKTLPAYFTSPEGLRLEVVRAIGDPGYFVRITNYASVERRIEYVGVMPASFRPLWPPRARFTRRVSTKRNSVESLVEHTISVRADITLPSGASHSFLVPQPLDLEEASESTVKDYEILVERDAQWHRDHGGRPSIVPYVRLAAGNMVLGKKIRLERELQCLAMMSCRCGHSPSQHQIVKRKRLAAKMSFLARCEKCGCRRYREVGEQIEVGEGS